MDLESQWMLWFDQHMTLNPRKHRKEQLSTLPGSLMPQLQNSSQFSLLLDLLEWWVKLWALLEKKTTKTKGKGQEEGKTDQRQGIAKHNLLKPNQEEENKVKTLVVEVAEEVVEEAVVEDVDADVKEVLEMEVILLDQLQLIKERIRNHLWRIQITMGLKLNSLRSKQNYCCLSKVWRHYSTMEESIKDQTWTKTSYVYTGTINVCLQHVQDTLYRQKDSLFSKLQWTMTNPLSGMSSLKVPNINLNLFSKPGRGRSQLPPST